MSEYTPPAPPPSDPGPGWEAPAQKVDAKGFFGALFDFSFSSFVTPRIVKVVYILATVAVGVLLLAMVGSALAMLGDDQAGMGLLLLLASPVIALIYLAIIRMTLEFYFAIVRMSEDLHRRLPGA